MGKVLVVSGVAAASILTTIILMIDLKVFQNEKASCHDRFCSFKDLKQVYQEGEDWEIQTRDDSSSKLLVSAIHGGGIEQVTSQVADAVAGDRYNFYTFKGKLSSGNFDNLHITSTHFDEPAALRMVSAVDHHISIHGTKGEVPKTLLGGLNKDLKELIASSLEQNGFTVEDAPEDLDGDHPKNIVNQSKTGQGVQLELTTAQRKAFFKDGEIDYSSRNDPFNQTAAFDRYVQAIQSAIEEYGEI
ncbi:poly-gamma-glutamate hydrolase family protein [Halobacillus mangrovi]|uniref:poly-gamma-glutamate hydrolase family protein n=1 Tax=Halobacillus mangrovi TaxID=402384 RepID=UPI003D99297F